MYNPLVDVSPVSQTGYVDLKAAFYNGSVPSDLDSSSISYNEIDDPDNIIGRPEDIFEASRMRDYAESVGAKSDEPKSN